MPHPPSRQSSVAVRPMGAQAVRQALEAAADSDTRRAAIRQLRHALPPSEERLPPARFCLEGVAGTLVELSASGASACLSFAFALVLDAQRHGEPVAWLTPEEHVFFPPDAAASGTDLDALVVVRLADGRRLPRAAEQLARSGAFGLLLLDLGHTPVPQAMLTRLTGLAQKHGTAIVFLTAKESGAPSLGSLVSLRGEVRRKRVADGRFRCELHALKDKRRGPGWRHHESFDGPPGLR